MTRRPLIAALGLAAALGLSACSGSGATTPPATDAPVTDAPATQAASDPPAAAGPCAPSTEAGTVTVNIEGFAFGPSTVEAKVGEVIAFTNNDSASHTATLDAGDCTTDGLGSGETGALVFREAGSYPFHCRIHPDMTGTFEISS
jgi:plastocyanin